MTRREAAWAKAHPTKLNLQSPIPNRHFYSIICVLAIVGLWAPVSGAERIRLDADMLINVSGQRPAAELIDEQDLAANTVKFNSSGLTNEKWNRHQPKRSWFYVATSSPVTLVTLQPNSPTGHQTTLTPNNGRVTLTVTERPAFVVVR